MAATQEHIQKKIEQRLRQHVDPDAVGSVCEQVLRGQVVHLDLEKKFAVVAFRHGVLFVDGQEYVIGDE